MIIDWSHAWPTATAAFLASLVEFVEALTVVLAVGATHGWRGALAGSGAALFVLLLIVAVLGPALTAIPLNVVQLLVGMLLLLFGMRWLRKAVLRSAGVIPLHDEGATFEQETQTLRQLGKINGSWDRVAVATSFKITMLEGLEVVFIVVAVGAGGVGLLVPASVGAVAALLCVLLLGIVIHKPLAAIPENSLKLRGRFAVGLWRLLGGRRSRVELAGRGLVPADIDRRFRCRRTSLSSYVPRPGSGSCFARELGRRWDRLVQSSKSCSAYSLTTAIWPSPSQRGSGLCGCCQDSCISTAAGWSCFSASRACLLKAPSVAPQGANSERRQQRHYDRQPPAC
jgi:Ca2+/H+ antiporter, TMEM165/GDT1 family